MLKAFLGLVVAFSAAAFFATASADDKACPNCGACTLATHEPSRSKAVRHARRVIPRTHG